MTALNEPESIKSLTEKINEFAKVRDWEQYHSPKNLAAALSVEASELLEIFQWMTDEDSRNVSNEVLKKTEAELADIFIYLLRISSVLNVNIIDATKEKIRHNEAKYPTKLVKGQSKKYNEY